MGSIDKKRRVYVSEQAYVKLKEMSVEQKELLSGNKGMKGVLDLIILGKTTSKGSGRSKKVPE